MSARSRTTRSPGFERGGSARSARGQPRPQLLRPVVAAVPPYQRPKLRHQSSRLRRKPSARVAVAASSRRLLRLSKQRQTQRLPSSHRCPARASSTRRRKQRRRLMPQLMPWQRPRPLPSPPSPTSATQTVPMKLYRHARLTVARRRHRARRRSVQHRLRQLRLRRSHPLRYRVRRSRRAGRPSVPAHVPWFRARRVLVRLQLELRSRRRVPSHRRRRERQPVSPERVAKTGRAPMIAADGAARRESEDLSIRKPCRRASRVP